MKHLLAGDLLIHKHNAIPKRAIVRFSRLPIVYTAILMITGVGLFGFTHLALAQDVLVTPVQSPQTSSTTTPQSATTTSPPQPIAPASSQLGANPTTAPAPATASPYAAALQALPPIVSATTNQTLPAAVIPAPTLPASNEAALSTAQNTVLDSALSNKKTVRAIPPNATTAKLPMFQQDMELRERVAP